MEKVAVGVYLLTPANVSVSAEDRQAWPSSGYHVTSPCPAHRCPWVAVPAPRAS